jgi:hypothetical protein
MFLIADEISKGGADSLSDLIRVHPPPVRSDAHCGKSKPGQRSAGDLQISPRNDIPIIAHSIENESGIRVSVLPEKKKCPVRQILKKCVI